MFDKEGTGEGAAAYRKFFEFPMIPGRDEVVRGVVYDCKGRSFGPIGTWLTPGGTMRDGTRIEKVKEYGLLHGIIEAQPGMIQDLRGLPLLRRNCCPEEIVAAILGAEEIAD